MNKIKSYITAGRVKSLLIGLVVVLVGVTMIRSGGLFGSISWLRNGNDAEYLKDQKVDNLSFENAELVYEDGISTLTVEVRNDSGSDYALKYVSINIKDDNDNTSTLIGYVGNTLKKDETKLITASIDKDLSSSTGLEYVVNK